MASLRSSGQASTSYATAKFSSTAPWVRRPRPHRVPPQPAAVVYPAAAASVQDAKVALLSALEFTGRGRNASKMQRAIIEEAQVAVEVFGGDELDFSLLEGNWRLVYTTAADVVGISTVSLVSGVLHWAPGDAEGTRK